ncbi:PAF acetylhydrolase family protein [Clohesyomyces aquaticus]|uniref:1-alkyl-2-acetylglycerophosphocholine esterase n=1 Tax=Clohesyomyces aquaticus TaxID=1231657 RepID=A0A1Y2AA32_9PLEO|nr:PAF acetylhydrolase family protein [Clohesyomyces aquaticus]
MTGFSKFPLSILHLLFLSTAYAQIIIPEPKGQYAVGRSTIKLTDSSRKDPYDPNHGPRNVMTSLFYPISRNNCPKICPGQYMPPATAALNDQMYGNLGIPNGSFGSFQLQLCCSTPSSAAKEATDAPLILFSPGLGGTRLLYNAFAQSLASAGYAVATMDHVYETAIVEYPDGSIVLGLPGDYWDNTIPGRLESLLDVRVLDARFILTQLGRKDVVQKLIPGSRCGFDITSGKVAMYGHSFGGATSLATLMRDHRFAGAMNLDGMQYGNNTDTKKPAVFFGRADPSPHNRTTDASWVDTWTHLKGWKRELGLKTVEHRTFGDAPLLLYLLTGGSGQIPAGLAEVIGTMPLERSFGLITRIVEEFMGFVIWGRKSALLDGKDPGVPELVVEW